MIKWCRFVLRLILLLVAIGAIVISIKFFYSFHQLTIDQVADLLNIFSSQPILSIGVGVGLALFMLSLLGFIMLLQYPLWRYPFSVFLGYIIGCFIYYHFYCMHPFENSMLQLNNNAWYYPIVAATALLLRAIIGFKMPSFNKRTTINS